MRGICYGVSVGPGDPELMTLKALRRIRQCPVVAAPQTGGERCAALTIAQGAADLTGKEILPLPMVMSREPGAADRGYDAAAAAIARRLDQGRDVAVLTLGDTSLYATMGYLAQRLRRDGYEVELVPGVPSFCAAAAALGVPLAERSGPFHVLPAGMSSLSQCLRLSGSKVILKLGRDFDRVRQQIDQEGLTGRATVVENATLPEEKRVPLAQWTGTPGYFTLIVIEGG